MLKIVFKNDDLMLNVKVKNAVKSIRISNYSEIAGRLYKVVEKTVTNICITFFVTL